MSAAVLQNPSFDFDEPDPFATMEESAPTTSFDEDPFLDDPLAGDMTEEEPSMGALEDEEDPFASMPESELAAGAQQRDMDMSTLDDEAGPSPLETLAQRLASPVPDDEFPSYSQLIPPAAPTAGPSTFSSSTTSSPYATISARSFSGKLVLFTRRIKRVATRIHKPDATNLLAVPIHRMMDNIAISASRYVPRPAVASSSSASLSGPPKDMWVDKYRPKRYIDLVGNESVHLATLSWLKEWDQCVFKRRPNKRKRDKMAADKQKDAFNNSGGMEVPPDEWGRPREKILLLSGPPGLGKTTLAHVIATQAGYNVLEVNASDARTGNVIDERIKPALETGRGLGKNKPVLVVVDEVDGATGENSSSFIAKLVQLTIDGNKKARRPKPGQPSNGKKPLLRPIICICNDLYAPSIAKLRSIAKIVRFHPPAPQQLVKRLREICDCEGLKADTRALNLLVGVAKGDFRGCLNTLQMLHTRKHDVTENAVRAATVGMKEGETSTQAVWNDIFFPMSKKRAKEAGGTEDERSKYVGRLTRLVEASGTMDKIMLGCFSHYANLHRLDPSFARYNKAHFWFGTFDHFSGTMRSEQEYSMLQYLPYFVAPIHGLFVDSENSKPAPSPSSEDWEAHLKLKTTEEVVKMMAGVMVNDKGRYSAGFRHLLGKEVVVTEFAPLLNRILSPPLRPVNSQVIRPAEKAMLKKLVDVMVSLDVRFVQERQEDGQIMYRLDPPIDMFVTYEGRRPADIAQSKFAVRHMVATEIEAECAARQQDAIEKGTTGKKAGASSSSFFGSKKRKAPEEEHEDHQQPLEAMYHDDEPPVRDELTRVQNDGGVEAKEKTKEKVDIVEKPPVDFFGRPLKPASSIGPPKSKVGGSASAAPIGPPPAKKYKVAYRFNEGASAAVRKPVKMSSLL